MSIYEDKVSHILCIDQNSMTLKLLHSVLDKNGYLVSTEECGKKVIKKLEKCDNVDLIVLASNLRLTTGFDVAKMLKKSAYADIPIIFLMSNHEEDNIKMAYASGGVDYIVKPFKSVELLARISTQLKLHFYKNSEQDKIQTELIHVLSTLSSIHDKETADHVKRVSEYTGLLARLVGYDEQRCEMIKNAAEMHDIGKVTTPDYVLKKPDKHTDEERKVMHKHAQSGYDILKHSNLPLFQIAAIMAHQHHEYYDGSGYPQGLIGNQIHILGRMLGLVDVFDALSSTRVYKKAWDMNDVFSFFKARSGKQFDPNLVTLLIDNFGLFLDIRDKYEK